MKRTCLMIAVVALSATLSGMEATAGERQAGAVPSAVLADLGLAGMQTMPDEVARTVRGKTGIHLGASPIEAQLGGKAIILILPSPHLKFQEQVLPIAATGGIQQAVAVPPIIKK